MPFDDTVALVPEPNIRPTFNANRQYVSGGIGIMVYDGVNAMDAFGPHQTFASAGLQPFFVSVSRDSDGRYKNTITANSGAVLTATRTLDDTPELDVLVVTGGAIETAQLTRDVEVLTWIKQIHQHTVWTSSVCTGAWVLGAAGLLKGKKATSNWYRADELLEHFGANPRSRQRYVFDGKIVTAAGVTAGIDMALAMIQTVFRHDLNNGKDFTQAVMLDLQYDPDPPVRGGSPSNTQPHVYEGMLRMYDSLELGSMVKSVPAP